MLSFAFPTKKSGGKNKKPTRAPKEEQLGGGEKKEGEELDAFPVRPFITAYRGAAVCEGGDVGDVVDGSGGGVVCFFRWPGGCEAGFEGADGGETAWVGEEVV